jgi:hypothetical protein
LRRSIFVPANAQNRRLGVEIDDSRNLHKHDPNMQGSRSYFRTLEPNGLN